MKQTSNLVLGDNEQTCGRPHQGDALGLFKENHKKRMRNAMKVQLPASACVTASRGPTSPSPLLFFPLILSFLLSSLLPCHLSDLLSSLSLSFSLLSYSVLSFPLILSLLSSFLCPSPLSIPLLSSTPSSCSFSSHLLTSLLSILLSLLFSSHLLSLLAPLLLFFPALLSSPIPLLPSSPPSPI